jgi:major membrane immunogen (membrane-anchored lipoprotein)
MYNTFQNRGMKKALLIISGIVLLAFTGNDRFRDGQFSGTSRAIYIDEPLYGSIRITVTDGKITRVDFTVRDSSKHEFFNGEYEKYMNGNALYIQQCRNDWKGVRSYPDSLLKYQDIDRVDAISGATWSYNIFRASVLEALEHANKTSENQ